MTFGRRSSLLIKVVLETSPKFRVVRGTKAITCSDTNTCALFLFLRLVLTGIHEWRVIGVKEQPEWKCICIPAVPATEDDVTERTATRFLSFSVHAHGSRLCATIQVGHFFDRCSIKFPSFC